MVLYYYQPYVSGLSIHTKNIAEGLVAKGCDVTILTSRYEDTLPKKEVINGVTVLRRPVLFKFGKGVILPTLIFDIIRLARKHDYVNPILPMAEVGPALLFVKKRKILVTYICDLFLGSDILSRFITFLSFASMRLALMRASRIFVNSYDYMEHSRMKRYLAKAITAYPPVNATAFSPSHDKKDFLKDTLSIDTKTKKIGFVGRIVYEKGIGYLLDSIQYIEKEIDDFKIIIVGDYKKIAGGSVKDELDEYMEKYPDKIIFTGYLNDEDLTRFYSEIDVLVLPSIDALESFGMVQVEAMLCGAPVVTSNLPGVREIIQKTGYGQISRVRDSKDIAAKTIEVLRHPSKYKPVRKTVLSHFDPMKPIETYMKTMAAKNRF